MTIFNFAFSICSVFLEMDYILGEDFDFHFMQLTKMKRTEVSWSYYPMILTLSYYFSKRKQK